MFDWNLNSSLNWDFKLVHQSKTVIKNKNILDEGDNYKMRLGGKGENTIKTTTFKRIIAFLNLKVILVVN